VQSESIKGCGLLGQWPREYHWTFIVYYYCFTFRWRLIPFLSCVLWTPTGFQQCPEPPSLWERICTVPHTIIWAVEIIKQREYIPVRDKRKINLQLCIKSILKTTSLYWNNGSVLLTLHTEYPSRCSIETQNYGTRSNEIILLNRNFDFPNLFTYCKECYMFIELFRQENCIKLTHNREVVSALSFVHLHVSFTQWLNFDKAFCC
jgi:hypothetical protein